MSWKTGLARLLGQDISDAIHEYGRPARGGTYVTEKPTVVPPPPPGLIREDGRAFAPHCDQRILHAPGDCWACDLYPDWQKLRELWGIAFTGHQPDIRVGQVECPADYNRPPGSKADHRQWGPNQAQGEHP